MPVFCVYTTPHTTSYPPHVCACMHAYVVIKGHHLATNVWERMVLNLVPVSSPYWITVDSVIIL